MNPGLGHYFVDEEDIVERGQLSSNESLFHQC